MKEKIKHMLWRFFFWMYADIKYDEMVEYFNKEKTDERIRF